MKKHALFIISLLIISCSIHSTSAQIVTSVAGLDFGTDYYTAKKYLTNHFGYNNYDYKGDYMLTFYDVMIGGLTYETAEFYFKNSTFVAARFYTGFPLSKLNDAKSFRDRIISRYKEKYWYNKPYTSNGFQHYAFGKSMYPNYEYYAISVWICKTTNENNGNLIYAVGCDYYMQLINQDNDDI